MSDVLFYFVGTVVCCLHIIVIYFLDTSTILLIVLRYRPWYCVSRILLEKKLNSLLLFHSYGIILQKIVLCSLIPLEARNISFAAR